MRNESKSDGTLYRNTEHKVNRTFHSVVVGFLFGRP